MAELATQELPLLPRISGYASYDIQFKDVFDCYRDPGSQKASLVAEYNRNWYRVQELDGVISLEHEKVLGDYSKQYVPVLWLTCEAGRQQLLVPEDDLSVPRDAKVTPEFVLRGILHTIQQRPYVWAG